MKIEFLCMEGWNLFILGCPCVDILKCMSIHVCTVLHVHVSLIESPSWTPQSIYSWFGVCGVFAGLITEAFSFILSLNSPVYQVCDALVEVLWLLCIVYVIRPHPAELQLVRSLPRKRTVVGLSPTRGS